MANETRTKRRFQDIPQFPSANYTIDIEWGYLERWIDSCSEPPIQFIELDPVYQRGYVWTPAQQTAYIEYILRGGFSGKDLFWNCPNWTRFNKKSNDPIEQRRLDTLELVDGKQRLTAVRAFLRNEVPIFGDAVFGDYEDRLRMTDASFKMHINNLYSQKEVVEWYIAFNTGGSIHTEQDLQPAYALLTALSEDKR